MSTEWRCVSNTEFDAELRRMAADKTWRLTVLTGNSRIAVVTDSPDLFADIQALNKVLPKNSDSMAELIFSVKKSEDCVLVDQSRRRFFCYGGMHYGKLKSLISGIGSFLREDDHNQGFHAAAMKIHGLTCVIAAPPGFGKSTFLSYLLPELDAVITDDWCDLSLSANLDCRVIQVDSNVSCNLNGSSGAQIAVGARIMAREHRVCKCGWREKAFAALESIGCPVIYESPVQYFFFIDSMTSGCRNVDAQRLLEISLSTTPHTPFSDVASRKDEVNSSRLKFYENLIKAQHFGKCSIQIVRATTLDDGIQEILNSVREAIHRSIISELVMARSTIVAQLAKQSVSPLHFIYPIEIVSQICRDNRKVAVSIKKELLAHHIPIETLFVHGSTAKGRGQIAPNIEWVIENKEGMQMHTKVLPNCRDDLDLVCVCCDNWRMYESDIRAIVKKSDFAGVDITLNLIGKSEMESELKRNGSPAMRRILLMNSPMVLYGEDAFMAFQKQAEKCQCHIDWAHETDFRTLMRLSAILVSRNLLCFDFSESDLMTVLPTFLLSAREGFHIGFPKERAKIKGLEQ